MPNIVDLRERIKRIHNAAVVCQARKGLDTATRENLGLIAAEALSLQQELEPDSEGAIARAIAFLARVAHYLIGMNNGD